MFRFEKLEIWHESIKYTKDVYHITRTFPKNETYSIVDQLRRSSDSIPANIAEGSGSTSNKDFAHYLDIAIKSVYETVSHLHVAYIQSYITEEERDRLYSDAEILVKKIQSFKNWLKNQK